MAGKKAKSRSPPGDGLRYLLRNFDIFEGAGGTLAPTDKTFHNVEPNAQAKLALSFVPVSDYAGVNGIEVRAGRRA